MSENKQTATLSFSKDKYGDYCLQIRERTIINSTINENGIVEIYAIFTDIDEYKKNQESIKIENPQSASSVASIKDCKTGHIFQYGLEALKRCNITILE